ncbi:MAG: hypothetical protein E7410_01790 [Ruminococcaceae bacterium]|nr:hypothetical protein [Oscillospiraceae bacterium]
MKRKSFIYLAVVLVLIILAMFGANSLKQERIQADINTKFMSDYGNLIIGMLNRSIQTEEDAIHKYDIENTKYGYRLVELYPYNSYLKHHCFNDIIMLLDQASGCDAYYEIDMNKELYDKLNALGQAVFSKSQSYTQEMLEQTWQALSEAVDFR